MYRRRQVERRRRGRCVRATGGLREPEALGVLDHHHGRLGHVDADLDHRGGDQEPGLAGGKARHGAVFVGAFHAAVHEIDLGAKCLLSAAKRFLRSREVGVLGLLHQRADPIRAPAFRERATDGADHLVEPAEGDGSGIDQLTAGGLSRSSKCPCRRNR